MRDQTIIPCTVNPRRSGVKRNRGCYADLPASTGPRCSPRAYPSTTAQLRNRYATRDLNEPGLDEIEELTRANESETYRGALLALVNGVRRSRAALDDAIEHRQAVQGGVRAP